MGLVTFILGCIAYILLLAYTIAVSRVKQTPTMLSEEYYIMNSSCSSLLMATMATDLLPNMLDMGGLQCMAFLAAGGLLFVAFAPAYLSKVERKVHKAGALIAAGASVVWTLCLPSIASNVVLITILAVAALPMVRFRKYWILIAEIAALTNVVAQVTMSEIFNL